MADREFTPSNYVDMTPSAAQNWFQRCPTKVPTLIVNPEATLHDRVGLAYGLVGELVAIAGGASDHSDDTVPRYILSLISDKLDKLDTLLCDIGDRTSAWHQPEGA